MEMTTTSQSPAWYPPQTYQSLQSFQTARSGIALVSSSQHLDLSLVTEEGDKVTLSLDAQSAALSAFQEQLQADEGGVSYEKSELTMAMYQRDMTFSVEGDLNAEELRDIGKVMKRLDKMMTHFLSGELDAMASDAGKLKGLDTIAGLEANMSYERQIMVAQQSQIAATYNQSGLPEMSRPEGPVLHDNGQNERIKELAGNMAGEIQSTATPVKRMMQFVHQLIKDQRQQAGRRHHQGPRLVDGVNRHLNKVLEKGMDFEKGGVEAGHRKTHRPLGGEKNPGPQFRRVT